MSENQFAPVVEALVSKLTADVQELHDISAAYKARNGSPEAVQEYLANSEDAEIRKELEVIANAEAKLKARKDALTAKAKAALVPEGFDPEAVATEFKAKRTAAKTLILQGKGTLEAMGQDVSALTELFENLPNISGGVSASGKSPEEMEKIRAWARDNGFEVKDRGRIAKEILDAYEAAK